MIIYLTKNSEKVRQQLKDSGLTVCYCANQDRYCNAIWLRCNVPDFGENICDDEYKFEVHGVEQEELISELHYSSYRKNVVLTSDTNKFITFVKHELNKRGVLAEEHLFRCIGKKMSIYLNKQ